MMTGAFDQKFTASQVATAADMNIETLRVWRRRKQIVLEGETAGWTRFTFNDLMLVATYNNLVQSHCSNAMAEMIAIQINIDMRGQWQGALFADTGVHCFCNISRDGRALTIKTLVGIEKLFEEIKTTARDLRRNPTYHVVDCTALLLRVLTKLAEMNIETPNLKTLSNEQEQQTCPRQ